MGIENTYRDSLEIINVSQLTTKYVRTYKTVILTFQSKVLQGLLDNFLVTPVPEKEFGSAHGKYPIYEVNNLEDTLFYLCPVGAPSAVGVLEEITYVFGIKNIIMYGTCGVLNNEITEGKIIIPTESYRDEGTSYHYVPASDFISIKNHNKVIDFFQQAKIDYVSGKIWTTDAFYRETEEIVKERINQGCIAVEMEVSAVQAFAIKRELEFYTFIYGADNLASKTWEKRILGNLSVDERIRYFDIASNFAKFLHS